MDSVRPDSHHFRMFLAELICSDEDCGAAIEAVGSADELELVVCDGCGCCMQVVAISAWEPAVLAVRPLLLRAA